MCGIVGITGASPRTDDAIEALKRLEYRGYDSFGVAVLSGDRLWLKKDVGSVGENAESGFFADVPASPLALAHTRWATHGGVTARNAHPHLSADGRFAIVHNGVIENHLEIRRELEAEGVAFGSETDSEAIAQLLAREYAARGDLFAAFSATVGRLEGEYAVVAISSAEPGTLLAARHKSPLAFGRFEDSLIVASDQRAIAPLTREITFLEDGDLLSGDPDGARCFRLDGGEPVPIERPSLTVEWDDDEVDRAGYPHYMLKEIHEVPASAETVARMRRETLEPAVADLEAKTVSLTGAGSAFYVAQVGQYYFSDLAGRYVRTHPSDEILGLCDFGPGDHLIGVSQSGETFDTLEACRVARERGAKVTAINNVASSSSQRVADFPIYQGSGPEICVLSTKSIISQCLILYRLALIDAERSGRMGDEELGRHRAALDRFPAVAARVLDECSERIQRVAIENSSIDNWFFIGRGIHYPVAMESALKFKEVSYHHAEGMPAGFFKHGTISLIDDSFYTIAFLPHSEDDRELFGMMLSNISEIQARGGKVIALGHDPVGEIALQGLREYIVLPAAGRHLNPLVQLVAGQLLAYHCARALGRNIDKPRALAKAVTVR